MSKFIHALVIERVEYDESTVGDYGQPTEQTATSWTSAGLVQPRSRVDELDDYRSAGTEVADHIIFLPRGTEVRHADTIVFETERYHIVGVRRFRYGGLAHIEVDARLISPTPAAVGGS